MMYIYVCLLASESSFRLSQIALVEKKNISILFTSLCISPSIPVGICIHKISSICLAYTNTKHGQTQKAQALYSSFQQISHASTIKPTPSRCLIKHIHTKLLPRNNFLAKTQITAHPVLSALQQIQMKTGLKSQIWSSVGGFRTALHRGITVCYTLHLQSSLQHSNKS